MQRGAVRKGSRGLSRFTRSARELAIRAGEMTGNMIRPGETGPDSLTPLCDERPILLLHGFASSRDVLRPMQRHLQRTTGRAVIRVGTSPGRENLGQSARGIQNLIERLAESPRFQFTDVVGHSMGGLVATYLLKNLDRGRAVRTVVTLGTPHRGTPSALLGTLLFGLFCEAVWQMLPNSPFLEELLWTEVPDGADIVSIAGSKDILVPEAFTQLAPIPGHCNLRCDAANHLQLLFARPAMKLLRRALDPPDEELLAQRGAA